MSQNIRHRISVSLLVTLIASVGLVMIASPAHAAVAYKADTSADTGGGGPALVITKPAGVVAGDFMIAEITVESGSGTTITPPTPANSWTLILRTNNGGDVGIATYYRFAGASEGASYSWGVGGKKATGGIIAYTGVDTTTPLDVAAAGQTGSGTTGTAPSVTSTTANTLRLAFFGTKKDVASHTQPTNMTQQFFEANDGNGFESSANDEQRPTAGSVGTRDSTWAPSGEWVAQTVVLRSAPTNTCTKSGATLTITLLSTGTATIGRSGDNFNVVSAGVSDPTCGGATVNNIDTVNVTGGTGVNALTIDTSGGAFEPGATTGELETSEIEFTIDLAGGTDTVTVQGGGSNDFFDAQSSGIRLNNDADIDVTNTNVEAVALRGGAGADILKGSSNVESLIGEADNDKLLGGGGADLLEGGEGNDLASGGGNNDTIVGGEGHDNLLGRGGSDDINGAAGNDLLSPGGGAFADALDGGGGVDTADYGRTAGPTGVTVDLAIVGNGSTDATGNQDTISAGSDDLVGVEYLRGSFYNDTLRGDGVDNFIFGWGGDDLIEGRDGNDALSGGDGDDTLNGGEGSDKFHGGDGTDTCDGGNGTDDFTVDEGTCETETGTP
jgi:Ca2+-binding RTX toxin-like protein